jgi:hypothetical protein
MAPLRRIFSDSEANSIFSFSFMHSGELTKANVIVFGLTRPGLEPVADWPTGIPGKMDPKVMVHHFRNNRNN